MAGFEHNRQKEIDSWSQDQSTPPFHRYFMTEDKTDITLTSPVTKDDTVINVSSGHGFTGGGEYILINYGDYIQQSKVISVATDAITIGAPIGMDLPTVGVQIIRGVIDMNVDGATTPTTFYCRLGAGATPVDVQHLHVFMRHSGDADASKYGDLAALTNGIFVRKEDGIDQNLGVYKTNQDFIEFGATSSYNDKAPAGQYSSDFSFCVKQIYGVVLRLDPRENGILKVIVRDNLSTLLSHRITATGQQTLGE